MTSMRNGVALLVVVALLAMLSVTAGMAALASRTSASSVFVSLERLELRAALESAVARTALALSDESEPWRPDGRLYELEFDTITVQVRILAEAGRFDLNRGNPETLSLLLEELGVSALSAQRIAAATADWRDEDDDVQSNGAESSAYQAAGLPPPGNRPFIAVEEFRNVLGVDREIYAAAEPYLTLSGTEAVAADIAPPMLLEAAGVSRGDARRILSARTRGGRAPEIDGQPGFESSQPATYAVFLTAISNAGASMTREVMIHLPGEEALYDVLSHHSHVSGYAEFLNPEPET